MFWKQKTPTFRALKLQCFGAVLSRICDCGATAYSVTGNKIKVNYDVENLFAALVKKYAICTKHRT